MEFWKMNGAGNDFIILNHLTAPRSPADFPALARTLCERHRSIGADGLMVVDTPTEGGDFKMRFYNSDGSIGEMCGNGARCICRYGYETGLCGDVQRIETTAGLVTGTRISARTYRIRLNDVTAIELDKILLVDGTPHHCAYVELGSPPIPHLALEVAQLRDCDTDALRTLGRKLRWHSDLPKGANVNFYEIIGENLVYERTFERGVEDFTYACGTGTGSVIAALTLLGRVSGDNVQAEMQGGRLSVDATSEGGRITALHLTGPATIAAKGEAFFEGDATA